MTTHRRRHIPKKSDVLICYCGRMAGPHQYASACEEWDNDDADLAELPAWERSLILRERERVARNEAARDAWEPDPNSAYYRSGGR